MKSVAAILLLAVSCNAAPQVAILLLAASCNGAPQVAILLLASAVMLLLR